MLLSQLQLPPRFSEKLSGPAAIDYPGVVDSIAWHSQQPSCRSFLIYDLFTAISAFSSTHLRVSDRTRRSSSFKNVSSQSNTRKFGVFGLPVHVMTPEQFQLELSIETVTFFDSRKTSESRSSAVNASNDIIVNAAATSG